MERKKHKSFFHGLFGSLVVIETVFSENGWATPGSINIPQVSVRAKVDRRLSMFSRSKKEAPPTPWKKMMEPKCCIQWSFLTQSLL